MTRPQLSPACLAMKTILNLLFFSCGNIYEGELGAALACLSFLWKPSLRNPVHFYCDPSFKEPLKTRPSHQKWKNNDENKNKEASNIVSEHLAPYSQNVSNLYLLKTFIDTAQKLLL